MFSATRSPSAIPFNRSPWSRIPTHLLSSASPGLQIRPYSTDRPNKSPAEEESQPTSAGSLPTDSDPDLPHLTPSQKVHMTQIDQKPVTKRLATATCVVSFSNPKPWDLLQKHGGSTRKGDVFSVSRIAGIMAAKKTADIVPLCHPGLGITGVEVDITMQEPGPQVHNKHGSLRVVATVTCLGRTGVEMEAMTAVMGAALTVYDMCKAVDKGMVIGDVQVVEKMGGKSGHWVRGEKVASEGKTDH